MSPPENFVQSGAFLTASATENVNSVFNVDFGRSKHIYIALYVTCKSETNGSS